MTYSNPGDTVLDFTMGSGSCGVSAKLTGRNFVGIEMDQGYYNIAQERINSAEWDTVKAADKQLSTQLPEGVQTTPDVKYEQGVLDGIRNPDKKKKPASNLFIEEE
jgi:hypothetical protein